MNSKHLGDIYFIKDGKVLTEQATISEENMSKQSFSGFNKRLRLYSDKELASGSKDFSVIYRDYLNNNVTIIRAFHKAFGNMGEVTLLDDCNVDIYIPTNTTMLDIKPLKEILSNYNDNSSTITNLRNDGYDFYDFLYNYSNNKRSLPEICEYYYKEKSIALDTTTQEMFNKYRNFNMASLVLEDYSKYTLNNRNTGIIIILPELTIKKTVTKSFHKRECFDELKKYFQVNDNSSYIDLVSDNTIAISLITRDSIISYINANINDYQKESLKDFISEVYQIKTLKTDLIAGANIVDNKDIIYDGKLDGVVSFFEERQKKEL